MPTDLPGGTQWTPTQTSVVRGDRLGLHGNFIAPNVMAALDDGGVLHYRYYEGPAWVEDSEAKPQTAVVGDQWADLGYDNIQVRRCVTDSNAIELRWPVAAD